VQPILYFLLFLLPFLIFPLGPSFFEIPKVIGAEIAIFLLLFLKVSKGDFQVNKWQLLFIAGLFVISIGNLLMMGNFNSLYGNIFRLQGLLLFICLLLFSLISNNLLITKAKLGMYILPLLLLLLTVFLFGENASSRLVGSLGEPNSLATIAVLFTVVVYFKEAKYLRYLGLIVAPIIVVLSGSRSGLLALILVYFFIVINKVFKTGKKTLSLATLSCLAFILVSLSLPFFESGGWYEDRAAIWQTAFLAGQQNPLLGSGFGNIENTFHQQALVQNNSLQYQVVDSSHNFLLDFWIEGGIVGVFLILILIITNLLGLIKHKKQMEVLLLLCVIEAMFFNPVSIVVLIYFWYLMGQGFKPSPHK
jgi:O-antigen ligase